MTTTDLGHNAGWGQQPLYILHSIHPAQHDDDDDGDDGNDDDDDDDDDLKLSNGQCPCYK